MYFLCRPVLSVWGSGVIGMEEQAGCSGGRSGMLANVSSSYSSSFKLKTEKSKAITHYPKANDGGRSEMLANIFHLSSYSSSYKLKTGGQKF